MAFLFIRGASRFHLTKFPVVLSAKMQMYCNYEGWLIPFWVTYHGNWYNNSGLFFSPLSRKMCCSFRWQVYGSEGRGPQFGETPQSFAKTALMNNEWELTERWRCDSECSFRITNVSQLPMQNAVNWCDPIWFVRDRNFRITSSFFFPLISGSNKVKKRLEEMTTKWPVLLKEQSNDRNSLEALKLKRNFEKMDNPSRKNQRKSPVSGGPPAKVSRKRTKNGINKVCI